MLLLYYNPTNDKYYLRYYKSIHYDYRVGYVNQFEHIVVKILVIQDNGLVAVDDLQKYLLDCYYKGSKKETLKTRLINRTIDLLNKLNK